MRFMLTPVVMAIVCLAEVAEGGRGVMTSLPTNGSLVLGTVQEVKIIQRNSWVMTVAVEECFTGAPVNGVVQVNVLWGLGGVVTEPPADISGKRVLLMLSPDRDGFSVPAMHVPVFPQGLSFSVVSKDKKEDVWLDGLRMLCSIARKGGAEERRKELALFFDDPKFNFRTFC